MASQDSLLDVNSKQISTSKNVKVYSTFKSMNLRPEILRGIASMGFGAPSAIQQRAIVPIVAGRDVIAQAQSGTGKTATFSIALLQRLNVGLRTPQVLVVSSTRELAGQIYKVVKSLGDFLGAGCSLCVGGTRAGEVIKELKKGRQVISGTPGRILDLVKKRHIKTEHVKLLILDEADEMLQDNVFKQITNIYKFLPDAVQVVVISATMSPEVIELTSTFMVEPVKVLVKNKELSLDAIKQYVVQIKGDKYKFSALDDLNSRLHINQAIVFCNSKKKVEWLATEMTNAGYEVSSVHGEDHQSDRDSTMDRFRTGVTRVLITTDVWGRGIDVQGVTHVINYDLPTSRQQYLHRIGRTGRFGRQGTAINFVASDEDKAKIKQLEKHYKISIKPLPSLD